MEEKVMKKPNKTAAKKTAVKAADKMPAQKTAVKKTRNTPVKDAAVKTAKTVKKTPAKKADAAVTAAVEIDVKPMDCGEVKAAARRVAVVVGGSSGIGYHTALALCKEGYSVYNISRSETEPYGIRDITADAEKGSEIQQAIAKVIERENRIDVLVYSAGWSLASPLEHVTEEDLRKIFEVNYFGLVKALWAVVPVMRTQRSGRIVAVSSMGGTAPIPFDAPYSASKAAIDMTLRALAVELKPYNIKITSVQPGGVSTRFTYKRKVYKSEETGEYADAMAKAVAKLDQMEQNGMDPGDVADSIVSILSREYPPVESAVGFKNKASRLVCKILPGVLTDWFNRMTYDQ